MKMIELGVHDPNALLAELTKAGVPVVTIQFSRLTWKESAFCGVAFLPEDADLLKAQTIIGAHQPQMVPKNLPVALDISATISKMKNQKRTESR